MWFWLAFISAIIGAVEVILNKQTLHKVSAPVLAWSSFTLSIPVILYLSLREGIPAINLIFFLGAFASSVAFVFAKTIINQTLKDNLVSKIYPLTAFSGLFTYLFGLMLLSESIRIIPILGMMSVIFGSYILNADQAKEDFLKPIKLLFTTKASIFFLIAILLGSLTAIFDKLSINNTAPNSPIFTMLIEQLIMSIILTAYLFNKEKGVWLREVKNNFGLLFINSLVFLVVGLFVFYAYTGGPVALVLGIKRLQIFFILIMGLLFFKDKPTRHAWIATVIMIIGAIMIRLG